MFSSWWWLVVAAIAVHVRCAAAGCIPATTLWAVQIADTNASGLPSMLHSVDFYATASSATRLQVTGVQSSGCEQPGYPATEAFDGDHATHWTTCNTSINEYAIVQLAQPSDVQKFCIRQLPDVGHTAVTELLLLRALPGDTTWTALVRFEGLHEGHLCGTRPPIAGEDTPCPSPPPPPPPPFSPPLPPNAPSSPPQPPRPPAGAGGGGNSNNGGSTGSPTNLGGLSTVSSGNSNTVSSAVEKPASPPSPPRVPPSSPPLPSPPSIPPAPSEPPHGPSSAPTTPDTTSPPWPTIAAATSAIIGAIGLTAAFVAYHLGKWHVGRGCASSRLQPRPGPGSRTHTVGSISV